MQLIETISLAQLQPTGTKAELRAYFQQFGIIKDRNSKINASVLMSIQSDVRLAQSYAISKIQCVVVVMQ